MEKKLRDLGTFGGPDGDTSAINDAGEVVGWGGTTAQCHPAIEGGDAMAFLWRNGHKIKLGFLPQTDYSLPPGTLQERRSLALRLIARPAAATVAHFCGKTAQSSIGTR